MKKLEFETSKSRFVVIDNNQDDNMVIQFLKDIPYGSYMNRIKLSEITEDQASEIVDEPVKFFNPTNPYCVEDVVYINYNSGKGFWTAIESLHSLLESKGIHLFKNPYTNSTDLNSSFFSMQEDFNKEKEAEQKTFYNPYIFKM